MTKDSIEKKYSRKYCLDGVIFIVSWFKILLALLNVRVLWRKADQACRSITRVLLLASFLVFSHIAMIFGMVDPGIAGYAPEKPAVMQMHHHGGGDCSLQKLM